MLVHCLFEQSGTFKNEFKKLGYNALDYDIKNDFNQTDVVIDLFDEIKKSYYLSNSIFDTFKSGDLVLAFFPCVRFEEQIQMHFRGTAFQLRDYSLEHKLLYDLELHDSLHVNYQRITMLVLVCLRKNLKLIIENPYSTTHYLTKYWCIPAALIDKNRRDMGDYFNKPTQYWFINCKPCNNLVADPIVINKKYSVTNINGNSREVFRSLFSSDYAARFIKTYILGGILC